MRKNIHLAFAFLLLNSLIFDSCKKKDSETDDNHTCIEGTRYRTSLCSSEEDRIYFSNISSGGGGSWDLTDCLTECRETIFYNKIELLSTSVLRMHIYNKIIKCPGIPDELDQQDYTDDFVYSCSGATLVFDGITYTRH